MRQRALLLILLLCVSMISIANAAGTNDNFNDNILDNIWTQYVPAKPASETGGHILLDYTGGFTVKSGLKTNTTLLEFTPGQFIMEMDYTPVTVSDNCFIIGFVYETTSSHYVNFQLAKGGTLYLAQDNGVLDSVLTTVTPLISSNTYHLVFSRNATHLSFRIDGVEVLNNEVAYHDFVTDPYLVIYTTDPNPIEHISYIDNFYYDDNGAPFIRDIVQFGYSNTTINKGIGTFSPAVARSNNVNATTTVQYYTEDDTAHAGVDYAYTSGTVSFTDDSISELINSIQIYNVDPTISRTFKVHLTNPVNGNLGVNTTVNVTIMQTGTYSIIVNPATVQLFTNATATLSINDVSYRYDNIQWFMNGIPIDEYKLSGASQWQCWNGSAWVNCSNATAFSQSRYQDTAGEHAFQTFINYQNSRIGFAEGDFTVINNETQTLYYIRVVDNTGADISLFNGHFFESEDPSKDYTFTYSGYGCVLDMNRHYQGIVNSTGYLNGTIAFQTLYNTNTSSATQRTITIVMLGSDEPADSSKAFLDVKITDATTNEPIPDAIFVLAYASNGSSKSYNLYGSVKRITIDKATAYTYKASSSSYNAYTGSVTLNDGQGLLIIPLQPKPIATTVPTATPGTGGSGGVTVSYNPYTTVERQNQAMEMIDQLLNAGPGLMQLAILALFMGLIMMIFPAQNGKKRYR